VVVAAALVLTVTFVDAFAVLAVVPVVRDGLAAGPAADSRPAAGA